MTRNLLGDRITVVTGAAQGLGRAIAERFHEQGATVVLADLDGAVACTTAEEFGERCEGLECNVVDERAVGSLIEHVVARHGRLDALVNNAGITRDAMLHKMTLEQFRQVIDVHLQGTWLCSRAALAHMRSRAGGGRL